MRPALLAVLLAVAAPASAMPALTLPPGATETASEIASPASYAVPLAPWSDGQMSTQMAEGRVSRSAWRVPDTSSTTLALLAPLRDQLQAAGFEVLLECETAECGGFDFRFATPVLPEPDMHVDLGDFRFLSARGPGELPDYVSLLVSRSAAQGYIQIVSVIAEPAGASAGSAAGAGVTTDGTAKGISPPASSGPDATGPAAEAVANRPAAAPNDLGAQLLEDGKVILDGIDFASGTTALEPGDYPALAALAAFLKANPALRVTLVGHTDAEGGQAANLALSKKRAAAVRMRLISDFGIPAAQVAADGVGYLSPVASNLTETGRQKNRRVEAMLASTQ